MVLGWDVICVLVCLCSLMVFLVWFGCICVIIISFKLFNGWFKVCVIYWYMLFILVWL